MDVIELLEDVPVEPSWRIDPSVSITVLPRGQRGVVVHSHADEPLYEVEFVEAGGTGKTLALATLRANQMCFVERFTLGEE